MRPSESHRAPPAWDAIALIQPSADGSYSYGPEGMRMLAKQFQVLESGDLIDVIAWPFDRSDIWWALYGIATHLGEDELRSAGWMQRSARMVGTPQTYLDRAGECFCVLDWEADLNAMIGDAPSVVCDSSNLAAQLGQTLRKQAMPRLPISVLGERKRVAA
jgi:hypothetical protein